MSCYICTTKYGWRKKELECKNCKKSVCKECLTNKVVIPKLGAQETLVCTNCFINLKKLTDASNNSKQQQPPNYDHPSTYFGPSMKDLATSTSRTPQVGTGTLNNTLKEDPDVRLRERLDKLKEKNDAPVNYDIEAKFHEVTGRDAASAASGGNPVNSSQPKLTEAEEVLKLLEQTHQEVNIDNKYEDFLDENAKSNADKVIDMERRLLKLKGLDPEKVKEKRLDDYDSSENEDEAIDKIMKRYALVPTENPTITPLNSQQAGGHEEEEKELPWCCICNEDAVVRCHGCDDDLYCNRCFRECHDEIDTKSHSKSPYRAKVR